MIVGAFLSTGCATTDAVFVHPYDAGNTTVCFPAPATERHAHEGPLAQALIAHAVFEGARYELARFDLPEPLSQEKRRVLMERVERGMRARPGIEAVEVGTVAVAGRVTRVLSMRLRGQRFGKWLLSFPTPSQMLQVSVVGPASARERGDRFLSTQSAGCEAATRVRSDDRRSHLR